MYVEEVRPGKTAGPLDQNAVLDLLQDFVLHLLYLIRGKSAHGAGAAPHGAGLVLSLAIAQGPEPRTPAKKATVDQP